MTQKQLLKQILNEIDDAIASLKKAKSDAIDDSNIRKAIKSLDDAETKLKKVIRDIPGELTDPE